MSAAPFYDGFADSYHLVYGGDWDAAVERQGEALARLIRRLRPDARDALDCSCGIGTQAIGLARRGFRVTGTDLSAGAVERARREAERLGADVSFAVADFRDLSGVDGDFDVVLSYDNAVPHLLDDAEIESALAQMRSKLRPGGLLLVSTRDYDEALAARPATSEPLLVEGPPRRLVARFHDWEPEGPLHTLWFFVLTEGDGGWTLEQHSVRYRAVTRTALAALAGRAGFRDVEWLPTEETGLQQLLAAAS